MTFLSGAHDSCVTNVTVFDAPEPDAPEPPAELDFEPDELLSTLHAASAPTHASASTARPPRDIM